MRSSCATYFILAISLWIGGARVWSQEIPIANVARIEPVDFAKEVLPILQRSCLACHSASERQGELVLELPETMIKGGDHGPAIVPGSGGESLLVKLAAHQQDPVMPPLGNDVNANALSSDELGLLRLWIDQGARASGALGSMSPQQWQPLPTSVGPVYAVALTSDGQYAAASRANRLLVYHIPTGRLNAELTDPALSSTPTAAGRAATAHRDLIESLAINADGDLLASGSFREVKLWRRPRDVQLANLATGSPVTCMAVSPNGQQIATSGADHSIQLWNANNGERAITWKAHRDAVTSIRFTDDGKTLVTSSLDQSIRFWNVADGTARGAIETPTAINSTALVATEATSTPADANQVSTPKHLLVSGGSDPLLRTWNVPPSQPVKLDFAPAQLQRLASSADGQLTAMTVPDGTIRIAARRSPPGDAPLKVETLAEWKYDISPPTALAFVKPAATAAAAPADASSLPTLSTVSADGSIRIWQLPDHQLIERWRAGTVPLGSVAASANGALLASGAEDGTIALWNMATSKPLAFSGALESPMKVLAFNAQRTMCAAGGVLGGRHVVLVWNIESGQIIGTLVGHEAAIRSIAFSVDGSRVAAGSDDKSVRIWSVNEAGQPETAKLVGPTAPVTALAFSADGQQLLSGTEDNAVRLWNLNDKQPLKDFAGHTGPIVAVDFYGGNQPFSVSADRSIRFWNPADGAQLRAFNDPAIPQSAALRVNGQLLAVAADDKLVRIYQLDNGQLLKTLTGHTQVASALSFSGDGKRLLSTSASVAAIPNEVGEAISWDVESNPPRLLEALMRPGLTIAAFTATADRIVVGDTTGHLSSIGLRFMRRLEGHQQPITALRFHSNGQTLFSTSKDGTLRGFNTANDQATFNAGHGANIVSLAMSTDEQVLATAGDNNVVRLWQNNGSPYGSQQISGLPGAPSALSLSPDGSKVLVGCAGDKPQVVVYDTKTAAPLQRFTEHAQATCHLSLLPANAAGTTTILSASADSVWRWDVCAVQQFAGHGSAVTSLAAIPSTPWQVMSGSLDTTIRRWNLQNGQQLGQYGHGGAVVAIDVRSDGQRFASVSDNHTAKLWKIDGQTTAEMRGDIRRKALVARLTQQSNAAAQRLVVAKQRLEAVEKDVPLKTEAEKKAADMLAAMNKDIADKKLALQTAETAKIAAEKQAIEAAAGARKMLIAKNDAEQAAKTAAADVLVSQQQAAQLAAASNAAPNDPSLKSLAATAQQSVVDMQQKAQQLQAAVQAPIQAAQAAMNMANEASQKVSQVQKPFNDALAALKTAESAQNLASQQHVIAARELEVAKALVPVAQQSLVNTQVAVDAVKKLLDDANLAVNQADVAIRSVRFSPDGSVLATAGDFPSVHLWDGETGAPLTSLVGHTAALSGVTFVDRQRIASASTDQSLRVWDLNPSWRLERTIGAVERVDIISDRAMSVDFNAEATQLLIGSGVPSRNGELHIFNVADGNRILSLPRAHDDAIYSAKFSPDGKRVASAGADKYLRTWDLASGQLLRRFEGHTNYVMSLAWKGDGQTIVSAAADNTIKVWNAETGDQERTIENFGKQVTAVRYIGETDNIVSSCADKQIRMHNAANGGLFRSLTANSWLHAIDVTPDSNVIVTGAANGLMHVWNGNTSQLLQTIDVGSIPGSPSP